MDFTIKYYGLILDAIQKKGLKIHGVRDWFLNNESGILMRHDVDRIPENSLRMAIFEANQGIYTTYYFRMKKCSFDEKIIMKIHELGHEVGYHYEELSDFRGNYELAWSAFKKNLAQLSKLVPVSTIVMHGSPFSKFNNTAIWDKYDYKDLGILCEALLDIDYSDTYYLTDTGRSWSSTSVNLRDKVSSKMHANITGGSLNLIEFLNTLEGNIKCALAVHPERWSNNITQWVVQYQKDILANAAKRAVAYLR